MDAALVRGDQAVRGALQVEQVHRKPDRRPRGEPSTARSISVMIARFFAREPLGLLKTVPALGV